MVSFQRLFLGRFVSCFCFFVAVTVFVWWPNTLFGTTRSVDIFCNAFVVKQVLRAYTFLGLLLTFKKCCFYINTKF